MKQAYLFTIVIGALLLGWKTQAYAQPLQVSFDQDTVHACAGEPFTLQALVSGGTTPYQYLWSTGHVGESLVITPQVTVVQYVLQVTDGAGVTVSDSVWVQPLPECVFPGDGNGDRVADMRDLLVLGQAFGQQGPQRPNAHLQWVGQAAPAWGNMSIAGVDEVHSDADGDGVVAQSDFQVIRHNYSGPQTLGVSPIQSSGIPMSIRYAPGTYGPGDTLIAEVWVGQDPNTTDSLYGLAFSMGFDQFILQPSAVSVDLTGTDLGQWGQDVDGLDTVFFESEQVDVGLTRVDQVGRLAYGRMADIIVVIDDLSGKRSGIEMLTFFLTNITLLDAQGLPMPVNPSSTEVPIDFGGKTGIEEIAPGLVSVFPQPAQTQLSLAWPESWREATVSLTDVRGRSCLVQQGQGGEMTLEVNHLTPGMYLLRLQADAGVYSQKILIQSR